MGKGGKWRGEETEERRRKEEGGMERETERDRGREGRRERVGGSVRMKATYEETILF